VRWPLDGQGLGTACRTDAAVGRCGVAGTGPEPAHMGGDARS
jgi:hypothetical protein